MFKYIYYFYIYILNTRLKSVFLRCNLLLFLHIYKLYIFKLVSIHAKYLSPNKKYMEFFLVSNNLYGASYSTKVMYFLTKIFLVTFSLRNGDELDECFEIIYTLRYFLLLIKTASSICHIFYKIFCNVYNPFTKTKWSYKNGCNWNCKRNLIWCVFIDFSIKWWAEAFFCKSSKNNFWIW